MNIYSLIKKANKVNSPRLKLFALFVFHITKRRYLGIFLDPVLACNLRCKMCYFSDEEYRKKLKGVIKIEDFTKIATAFFHRALKVQIGCGAEPTLYKELPALISIAKEKGVPYVSITTNGNLLNEDLIHRYIESGLDEITLSMHGVVKETYEYLMEKADYEKFCHVLNLLSKAKEKHKITVRINYTINEDNIDELSRFFEIFGHLKFDVLQLRPIEKIGNSEYDNFKHTKLIEKYETTILKVKKDAVARNIVCIAPSREQIIAPEGNNNNAVVFETSYCNISPRGCWQEDFDYETDTFESYGKKHRLATELFFNVFRSKKALNKRKKYLNYEVN